MASYEPPTEDLPIFDPSVFQSASDFLTVAQADARYLKFPTAQGTENFAAINVFGDASFNQDLSVTGTLTAGTFSIANLSIDHLHINTLLDCSGTVVFADTTAPGLNTELFTLGNAATTAKLSYIFNPTTGNYNPIVVAGDSVCSFGQNNGSIANYVIAPWSLTSCGLRMTKTTVLLGCGGTSATPTNNLSIDSSANTLTLTSPTIQVSGNVSSIAALGTNRQASFSYYNVSDISTGIQTTQIYQSAPTLIFDNNYATSGQYLFACNDSLGVQQTPLTLTATSASIAGNAIINGLGNYLQFPDGTQQTTAYTTSGTNKTYTVAYTSTQSITLPAGCTGISIRALGRGGAAGDSADGNAGTWASGGSGGGSSSVCSNNIIPLLAGSVLSLTVVGTAGGYTEIVYNSASLCKAYNGNAGGNASSGSSAGSAGAPQTLGSGNTTYGNWSILTGSAGIAGTANLAYQSPSGVPSTAGTPTGTAFSDVAYGCGQRYSAVGGINQYPTATTYNTGVCYITYYLQ